MHVLSGLVLRSLILGAVAGGLHAAAPAASSSGVIDAERSERIEAGLTAFFAAASASRAGIFQQRLASEGIGLDLAGLQVMADTDSAPLGTEGQPGRRVALPWSPQGKGRFNLLLPSGYSPGEAYPLVVMLHDRAATADRETGRFGASLARSGAVVLAPDAPGAPGDTAWGEPQAQSTVLRLMSWTVARYRIDLRRMAIVGRGDGGDGAWRLVRAYPALWQAAVLFGAIPTYDARVDPPRLQSMQLFVYATYTDGDHTSLRLAGAMREHAVALAKLGVRTEHHSLDGKDTDQPAIWDAVGTWLSARPQRAESPRGLLLPASGPALWEGVHDPNAIEADPAFALIRSGKHSQARSDIETRLARERDPQRQRALHLLRALATLPILLDPIPAQATGDLYASATAAATWGRTADSALSSLERAIHLDRVPGTPDPPDRFIARTYLYAAKIHAVRTMLSGGRGSTAWMEHYERFAQTITASMNAMPGDAETNQLVATMNRLLPSAQPPTAPGP